MSLEINGQGNWRYISFLKGYPEIAPIESEKPEEPSVNDPIVNPDTGKELSQTVVNKVVDKVQNAKKGSDYAIILSKKDDAANTGSKAENTTPKTGDSSPIAIYVCMMLLAGSLTIFVVRRRLSR